MKIFGWLYAFFCSLTGVYYGFYTGIFNTLFHSVLSKDYQLDPKDILPFAGDINAALATGLTLSTLFAGKFVFSQGRWRVLLFADFLALVLYFLIYINRSVYVMIVLRCLQGCIIGISKVASYSILTEIIPKQERGKATSFFMLNYALGVMIALQTGRVD